MAPRRPFVWIALALACLVGIAAASSAPARSASGTGMANCIRECPLSVDYACDDHGRLFRNACVLEVHACLRGRPAIMGPCPPSFASFEDQANAADAASAASPPEAAAARPATAALWGTDHTAASAATRRAAYRATAAAAAHPSDTRVVRRCNFHCAPDSEGPYCGSDGITYSSHCELRRTICELHTMGYGDAALIRLAHNGACGAARAADLQRLRALELDDDNDGDIGGGQQSASPVASDFGATSLQFLWRNGPALVYGFVAVVVITLVVIGARRTAAANADTGTTDGPVEVRLPPPYMTNRWHSQRAVYLQLTSAV